MSQGPAFQGTALASFQKCFVDLAKVTVELKAKRQREAKLGDHAHRPLFSPLSLHCRRCIIVGNGGVLANKSLGSRIDDYDIVVR